MNPAWLKTHTALTVLMTLEQLGMANTEISENKARKIYGKFFTDNVANGRLQPARRASGKTATKWYRVTDILALRDSEELDAYDYQVSATAARQATIIASLENNRKHKKKAL
jgi:hypothetical protein